MVITTLSATKDQQIQERLDTVKQKETGTFSQARLACEVVAKWLKKKQKAKEKT